MSMTNSTLAIGQYVTPSIFSVIIGGGTGYYWVNAASNSTTPSTVWTNVQEVSWVKGTLDAQIQALKIPKDWYGTIEFADGCLVEVKGTQYQVIDKNARVTYKANKEREFNRYLNASDLIEEFLVYLSSNNLKPQDALAIPLELLITFLVIRAAEADQEEQFVVEDKKRLESQISHLKEKPRCKGCGRFIRQNNAKKGAFFCSGAHMDSYLAKA